MYMKNNVGIIILVLVIIYSFNVNIFGMIGGVI